MSRKKSWTLEQEELVRAAYIRCAQAGPLCMPELIAATGRSENAISCKARALGLRDKSRPRMRPEDRKNRRKFSSMEEVRAYQSARQKEWIARNGHPRGMLGVKHTPEALQAISAASAAAWANPNSGVNSPECSEKRSNNILKRIVAGEMRTGYSRSRGGKRDDLGGIYFRSAWEANYARYLNLLVKNGDIAGWDFEPKTFVFEKIKRGTRAYTPDFRVDLHSGAHEWHEVKGWMDDKSKTRLVRFARYYPKEKLVIVDSKWFKSANKTLSRIVPNWESGTVHV